MTLLDQALNLSQESIEYEFDDKLYTIRRNLMVISTVTIASTFLSPPLSGKYSVNIGVIKGYLDNPEYISYFLALVCVYYLIWFHVHCRSVVVDNFKNIRRQFLSRVAVLRVSEIYNSFFCQFQFSMPGPPEFEFYNYHSHAGFKVGMNIHSQLEPDLKRQLEISGFLIEKRVAQLVLTFQYKDTSEDIVFLNVHKDHYCRRKASYLFITMLPVVYSFIACLFLMEHIYNR